MTEAQLQELIIETAEWLHYRIHHDRPARTRDGSWVTHIQGDIGFPDLVLAHPKTNTIIFAELKSAKGRVSPDQTAWIHALRGPTLPGDLEPGGRGVYVWTPADWHPNGGVILDSLVRGVGIEPKNQPERGTP